jgi:phospholipase C
MRKGSLTVLTMVELKGFDWYFGHLSIVLRF